MKKWSVLLLAALMLCQSGCRGSIYSIYRDVERLRPIQTMGLDVQDGCIVMSAAGIEPSGTAPFALCESGSSISQALVHLQNSFPEAEPYYAHVEYFLLGREAAEQGILSWLEWLERNPQMRLDTGIFVVDGSAAELVLNATGSQVGTTERMESLAQELKSLGEGHLYTVRQLASDLAERGAGLCGLIRVMDQQEIVKNEDSSSVLPAGFAVFKEDRMVEIIGEEEVPGVLLFLGKPQGARIEIQSENAGMVTLLLDSGRADTSYKDGVVEIRAELYASIIELEGSTDPDLPQLNQALAQEACRWICGLVERAQRLDCDYLGITNGDSPAGLEFRIQVAADVERSYDLREAEGRA